MSPDAQPGRRPRILMMGPFPPPVHGASQMTALLADRLEQEFDVRRCRLSPSPGGNGPARHIAKGWLHARALLCLFLPRNRRVTTYVSLPGGLALTFVLPIVLASRLRRNPLILHHHSFRYLETTARLLRLVVRLGGKDQVHLVLCQEMAAQLKNRYGKGLRTLALSNAWVCSTALAPAQRCDGPPRLGHLSNLSLEKGLDTVIAVFDIVAAQDPTATLSLAGPAADCKVVDLIDAAVARHPGRVIYRGPLFGDEKRQFLGELDYFLFFSRYEDEAEPLVVDEALAAGAHVLTLQRGCLCAGNYNQQSVTVLAQSVEPAAIARLLAHASPLPRGEAIAEAERRRIDATAQLVVFQEWIVAKATTTSTSTSASTLGGPKR